MASLFGQDDDMIPRGSSPGSPSNASTTSGSTPIVPATSVASSDNPFDLLDPDAMDPEVLDDDAFFATLRDAVHDDAPLGPRDEDGELDESRFFDQDADRGSFRDVFRRRR
jgi:hypothetical protein